MAKKERSKELLPTSLRLNGSYESAPFAVDSATTFVGKIEGASTGQLKVFVLDEDGKKIARASASYGFLKLAISSSDIKGELTIEAVVEESDNGIVFGVTKE